MKKNLKPSLEELQAARDKELRDLIKKDLTVLFCGINPGLYSAATGFHFARPGNRFWPALFNGGFTPRLLQPNQEKELLSLGYGITNIASRATNAASELNNEELIEGAKALSKKVKKYTPKIVAILGITAFKTAFERPSANYGLQNEKLEDSFVWLLPSPSGLNAHFKPSELAKVFRQLKEFADKL